MGAALRGGTALYAGATLLDRLLGLLLLPLLTRVLAPSDYGAWTQTTVTTGVLLPVVLFATPTAIVRWFAPPGSATWRPGHYLSLGAFATALFAACAAALWLGREPLAQLVYGEPGRAVLVAAMLTLLLAEAGVEFANAWLRAAGQLAWVAGVLAVRSALRFGLVVLLVGGGDLPLAGWLGRYAAAQAAWAGLVLVAAYLALRQGAAAVANTALPPASLPGWRALLAFCGPLVLLALFTTFNTAFDRFLLVRLLGLDTVAVYAAASSLCSIPAVFYAVLGFTLFPLLAARWGEGRRDEAARLTSMALQVFVFLCLPLALALALAGPVLLPRITTAAFHAPWPVFALLGLSVAAFGVYQILLYALLLDGRSHQVLWLAMCAAVINALLNLLLAPRWGAVGAAAAAAAANTVRVVGATRWAGRVMPWRFPWTALRPVLVGSVRAAAPLALVLAWQPQGATAWAAFAAALALGAAVQFGLDWARPQSLTRMLLQR